MFPERITDPFMNSKHTTSVRSNWIFSQFINYSLKPLTQFVFTELFRFIDAEFKSITLSSDIQQNHTIKTHYTTT